MTLNRSHKLQILNDYVNDIHFTYSYLRSCRYIGDLTSGSSSLDFIENMTALTI